MCILFPVMQDLFLLHDVIKSVMANLIACLSGHIFQ